MKYIDMVVEAKCLGFPFARKRCPYEDGFVCRTAAELPGEMADAERTEYNDAKLIAYLNEEYRLTCPRCGCESVIVEVR